MAIFIGTAMNDTASATGGGVMSGFAGFAGSTLAQLIDTVGDTFYGLGGNDRILAGSGNDVIYGGDGNDYIRGGSGYDNMDGGNGIDTLDTTDFNGSYVLNMTNGSTAMSAFGEWAFNFENAITGNGNDVITGTSGNNDIRTGGGNDWISGMGGDDTVNGGSGGDNMDGGTGIDMLIADETNYTINMTTGSTSVSGETVKNFENLRTAGGNDNVVGTSGKNYVTMGSGHDTAHGGEDDDSLLGEAGNDHIWGDGGNDFISGGSGTNYLTGGAGFDKFVIDSPQNSFTMINDFSVPDDVIRLNADEFVGIRGDTLNYLTAANFVRGTAARDADDHIIYNPSTGDLIYDANGNAAGGTITFAHIASNLNVTNQDFQVWSLLLEL